MYEWRLKKQLIIYYVVHEVCCGYRNYGFKNSVFVPRINKLTKRAVNCAQILCRDFPRWARGVCVPVYVYTCRSNNFSSTLNSLFQYSVFFTRTVSKVFDVLKRNEK